MRELRIKGRKRPRVDHKYPCPDLVPLGWNDPHRIFVWTRPVHRFGDTLVSVRTMACFQVIDGSIWNYHTEDDWKCYVANRVFARMHREPLLKRASNHRLVGVVGPGGRWWSPTGETRPAWADAVESA